MKKISSLVVILTLLFNSGCGSMTVSLWKKGRYQEVIKSYLVSDKSNKVVFLGQKYHYIFDDSSGTIRKLLLWSGKRKLTITIVAFEATSPTDVTSQIIISGLAAPQSNPLDDQIMSSKEVSFLKKLQFSGSSDSINYYTRYEKKITLTGNRYLPNPNVIYPNTDPLSRSYIVIVKNNYDTTLDKTKKVTLTPLAVVGDTVMIPLKIAGATLALTFFAVYIIHECKTKGPLCKGGFGR
jgi:hypothetical protein